MKNIKKVDRALYLNSFWRVPPKLQFPNYHTAKFPRSPSTAGEQRALLRNLISRFIQPSRAPVVDSRINFWEQGGDRLRADGSPSSPPAVTSAEPSRHRSRNFSLEIASHPARRRASSLKLKRDRTKDTFHFPSLL